MLNARWVRERRIEVVAPVATLQTEVGEWTLRRGVVPADVPVREVLRGRVTVDGAPVQIAGVLDDLYAARGTRGSGRPGRTACRRSRCGRRRRAP